MKRCVHVVGILAAILLSVSGKCADIVVEGQLTSGRVSTDTPPDLREAVVFFRADETGSPPGAGEPVTVRMNGKAFVPGVVVLTAGTLVRFPNMDPILHNAFSTSSQAPFDLGLYGRGDSREFRFETPGLVRVYCNVHHAMVGYVMVLDTPYFAQPDSAGKFRLSIPRGLAGQFHVWHPQSTAMRQSLSADADVSMDLVLNFTGRRVPRHLNKHGKHYQQRTTNY